METIQTVADLPLVAVQFEAAQREFDASLTELEAACEEQRTAMQLLEECKQRKPNYDNAVAALLSGQLDAGDPHQLVLAERALLVLRIRREAQSCKTALDAKLGDGNLLLQLTPLVARVVGLLQMAKETLRRDESVLECQQKAISLVKGALKQGLADLGWASESFVKPNEWRYVSTCLDWLLTLNEGNVRAAFKPLFEPLCKKFVFHFLETASSSRPDLFAQAIKWVQSVMALRSDFLVHKVQHGSMIELVREMSLLVAVRAKRDFSVLLKEATSEKNKLFLDSVDELFSFAEVCDLHYGYALQDVSLDHAVALALFPASGTAVTDYWLALERKAVEACETDSEVLAELQVRARRRLALLPLAEQRKSYFGNVHGPIVSNMVKNLQGDDDDDEDHLDELLVLSSVLGDWSVRPEFDQDDNLLSSLSSVCFKLFEMRSQEKAQADADFFVSSLTPWMSKNWLFVSKSATAVLFSGDVHLDLSSELCNPYERLRDVLRVEEKRIGSAFVHYALKVADLIDLGMVQLLLEVSPPISFELAKQLAFDASLVFGLWNNLSASSARLFKRFSDVLLVLQMDDNELTAVCAVEKMGIEHQRLFLSERFHIENLEPSTVIQCAKLRQDRE